MTENRRSRASENAAARHTAPENHSRPASGEAQEVSQIDLMEFLYRLLDSWKLILALVLVCCAVNYVYVSNRKITPMYRATSTIYVVSMETSVNISNLQLGNYMMSDYVKVFDIWEVQAEVRDKLGLPQTYPYGALRGMISVNHPENTRMLEITATSTDPIMAANVANTFATVVSDYIAETMKMDKPSLMSTARVPTAAFNTGRSLNMYRAILIGIALGAAIVFIQMLLDDKIKTAEDIRKYTGLPNLAVIPVEETLQKKNHQHTVHHSSKGRGEQA